MALPNFQSWNSPCIDFDFFKYIHLAIVDGIAHLINKSTNLENAENSAWQYIMECKENNIKYINTLRQKWVLGARQWMAGMNGSLQNHKLMFGYSDEEWSFIWSTMSEDGAWDVPSIKDSHGVEIKENYGPEMMIRYIAHDLKCHILVFDQQLDIIQFCSGNYLQKNNTICDIPLILYSTGNHFQTVIALRNHSFVEYVLQQENTTQQNSRVILKYFCYL